MPVKPYEAGVPSANRLPGQMITKPTCKWQVRQPSYKKGRTIFRPWPTVLESGEEVPWRDSEGRFGTSFFVQDLVCLGWGLDFRFTCLAEVSDPGNWPQGSPLQLFCDDMRTNADYKGLFDRVGGSFAPISNPRSCGFLKGLMIANAGKDFRKNPIWGCLLMMPPSMREAFDLLLNAPANPNCTVQYTSDQDPYGHSSRYLVGNPISLKQGKVFEFGKQSELTEDDGDKAPQVNLSGVAAPPSGREKSDIESYACRIWPKTPVLPIPFDKVKRWDMPFEDALWYLTGEEQINLCLIPGFGRSRKNALLYTFGGKDILPASFEFGRTTVDMGTQTAPQQSQPRQQEDTNDDEDGGINLDNDDQPTGDDEEDVMQPAVQTTAASAPAPQMSGTANDIRNRLNALGKK